MRSTIKYSIWVVTLACIYTICHVGLGWFFPLGTSENHERINSVLIGLSYSYMAGFVFYILVEYLPKSVAKKKAFLLWEKKIVNIYMWMSEIIAAMKMIHGIETEDKKILKEDLKGMEIYKPEYEKIYHTSAISINNSEAGTLIRQLFIFRDELVELAKSIRDEISNMVRLPSTSNVDIKLIEIISSIDSCDFLNMCESLLESPLLGVEHTRGGFDACFYNFIQLHEQLSNFKFNKHSYKYERMTGEEISAMKEEQTKTLQYLKENNIHLSNSKFYRDGIRYVIRNGQLLQ